MLPRLITVSVDESGTEEKRRWLKSDKPGEGKSNSLTEFSLNSCYSRLWEHHLSLFFYKLKLFFDQKYPSFWRTISTFLYFLDFLRMAEWIYLMYMWKDIRYYISVREAALPTSGHFLMTKHHQSVLLTTRLALPVLLKLLHLTESNKRPWLKGSNNLRRLSFKSSMLSNKQDLPWKLCHHHTWLLVSTT